VPEEVVIHEFGHQYFQGMIASNEFEEAWLDEGINSYATGRLMEEEFGPDATLISFLGLRLSGRDLIRLLYSPEARFDTIKQLAWEYMSDSSYTFNSYHRPELMLRTLEHHLGPQQMARAMRTYAERWRFKHPSTEDFLATMNEAAGRDLRPLLGPVLYHAAVLDYEVGPVTSTPAKGAPGYFDTPKGRTLTTQEEAEKVAQRAASTATAERALARSSAAPTKPRKSGAGRVGRDLNSGWNWLATNHGCSGSSTISTSRPSWNVPETTRPCCTSWSRNWLFTS